MSRLLVITTLLWLAIVNGVSAKGFMMGLGVSGGGVVTPCSAGKLDLSLSTGCNMPQFLMGVFGW